MTLFALLLGIASALPAQVDGLVLDATTGHPIAGAEIVAAASDSILAVTDDAGRWRLAEGVVTRELRVRHLGYATAEVVPEAGAPVVTRLRRRPIDLGAIVVTAGRRLQRLADAVVATEVVTGEEMRESGASDVAAVLTERTGIELAGGHPNGAGAMLQGLDAERLLILIDGQPLIGRISGQVDLSRVPTALVERVEVVKGPQSTLYGSDAMGGVVNIITRGPADRPWSASVRAVTGSEGRRESGGTGTVSRGPWSGLLQVGRRDIGLTPGIGDATGAQAGRWDGAFRAGWTAGSGRSAELAGFLVDERQRWRSGQLYQFADNVQWGVRASAAVTAGVHRFAPTFYATEFDHLARGGAETEPPAAGERERQRLLQASLVYATRVASVDVDAGVELRGESIRSDRVRGGSLDIGSVGGYAQASMPVGTATIVPGIRVTTSRAWGAHVTPRFALLVRPLPDIALRASIGTGYRAPAFKELGMQFLHIGPGFGYAVRGNPDLRPETSFNVTGGVEWSGEHVYLRAQGFANRLDDFIETQQTGDSAGVLLFTYDNIASGETRGVEFDAAATVGRGVRLEAGYARLIARGDDDEPLLGRPAHSGRLAWSYVRPSGLRLSLTSLHTGSTPVARDESGVLTRSSFTRFDARVTQSLPRGFEVAAGVDNVFDARPERWPGFAARQIHVSLAWNAGAR